MVVSREVSFGGSLWRLSEPADALLIYRTKVNALMMVRPSLQPPHRLPLTHLPVAARSPVFSRLLKERIIFLNGPVGLALAPCAPSDPLLTLSAPHHPQIDDALASVVVAQLLYLEAESPSPISL